MAGSLEPLFAFVETRIGHAEVRIGDSIVMLADESPDMNLLGPTARGGATGSIPHLHRGCRRHVRPCAPGRRDRGAFRRGPVLGRPDGGHWSIRSVAAGRWRRIRRISA